MNWTGHVLIAPRSNLASVLKRQEASRTGVYFLLGDMSFEQKVYIGESDDVGRRVLDHSKDEKKDFFEKFVLITSKDQNLTKAHARYLEGRLTEMARMAGRSKVENSTQPVGGILPESDLADMEFFINQIGIVRPVLGVDALRRTTVSSLINSSAGSGGATDGAENKALELIYPKNKYGYEATGFMKDGLLVVRAGSTSLKKPAFAESSMGSYKYLRDKLIEDGVLIEGSHPNLLVFSRDYEFASPSAAASVIHGGSRNGRYEWRVAETNLRLKDYEASLAEAAE
jgi:predicted GIY-YIG superfamily endonuclease